VSPVQKQCSLMSHISTFPPFWFFERLCFETPLHSLFFPRQTSRFFPPKLVPSLPPSTIFLWPYVSPSISLPPLFCDPCRTTKLDHPHPTDTRNLVPAFPNKSSPFHPIHGSPFSLPVFPICISPILTTPLGPYPNNTHPLILPPLRFSFPVVSVFLKCLSPIPLPPPPLCCPIGDFPLPSFPPPAVLP